MSPPTCRHWTAIAAPKHRSPHKRRLNTHQRKTSPHQKKITTTPSATTVISPPPRLAPLAPPPMSVLDLASQQPGAWTPSRLFSKVSHILAICECTCIGGIAFSTRPSRPSFCDTKPFVPHFPGQCSAALYTRAAEDSGPCRVWVSRLAELQGCVII